MGWNDHMEWIETKCKVCGRVRDWQYWDATGIARYSGGLGKKLGVDPSVSGKCPECGSTNGSTDENEWEDIDADIEYRDIEKHAPEK